MTARPPRASDGKHTSFGRGIVALAVVSAAPVVAAAAQQSAGQPDSARAEIRTTLRTFYYNLAHSDWEALTAAILAAKVVAHRPAPEALVATAATSPDGAAPAACSSAATAPADRATIALDGDWAAVSVSRCTVALAGLDQFRLIHFEGRWRFVYIDLFEEQMNLSTER